MPMRTGSMNHQTIASSVKSYKNPKLDGLMAKVPQTQTGHSVGSHLPKSSNQMKSHPNYQGLYQSPANQMIQNPSGVVQKSIQHPPMISKDIEDFLKYKQNMTQGVNITSNAVDRSQFAYFVNNKGQPSTSYNDNGPDNVPTTAMPTIMTSYPHQVKQVLAQNGISTSLNTQSSAKLHGGGAANTIN